MRFDPKTQNLKRYDFFGKAKSPFYQNISLRLKNKKVNIVDVRRKVWFRGEHLNFFEFP